MSALVFAQSGPVIPDFGGGGSCVRENRTFCWDWFHDHWGDTFQPALLQHIKLTLIAVAIGFVIALGGGARRPPARAGSRRRSPWSRGSSTRSPAWRCSSCWCRSPGLTRDHGGDRARLLHAADPLPQHPRRPARRARRTSASRRAAWGSAPARSCGASSCRWPLPAIVAGLRVAVVTVISLATVAAFVVDEGLGAPIFQSIASPFNTAFIAAGALAVAARADRRRAARARAAAPHALGGAPVNDFLDAFQFMGDNLSLLLEKTWDHILLSAAAIGVSLVHRDPAGRLARAPAPGLVRRDQRVQHRPRAAQPGRHRDPHRPGRPGLPQRARRAGRARRAADAHQRLRRRRPGRPRRRRGGPGDGDDRRWRSFWRVELPARRAADVRRHPHGGRLRHRHGDAGRDRRRRRPGRHHRQPGQLRDRGRARRRDVGRRARAARATSASARSSGPSRRAACARRPARSSAAPPSRPPSRPPRPCQ